jgi:hypothetical protein
VVAHIAVTFVLIDGATTVLSITRFHGFSLRIYGFLAIVNLLLLGSAILLSTLLGDSGFAGLVDR